MVASASISGFCWTKLGDRYVVMGCLCGYEQIFYKKVQKISLQKKHRRFPTQSELTIVLIPYKKLKIQEPFLLRT
jgi:hypothetical protein